MKYFIILTLALGLSGCRDFKMVLGDDSSKDTQESNTDSDNTITTTSSGKSLLDLGEK